MALTEQFDIHEHECVSLNKKTRIFSVQIDDHSVISKTISKGECNLIAAFIDLANDENGTGFASKKDMVELLGCPFKSFEVRLSNLRSKLAEMIIIQPNITANSFFLTTTLRGKVDDNMEKKPFEFNTRLALALKEGWPLDGIRTEPQKTIGLKENPKEFFDHVEEVAPPEVA